MANWKTYYVTVPTYICNGSNQHGARYSRKGFQRMNVCRITARREEAGDLLQLILLSHRLNVPVHYDFDADPQTAYIEVVSAEEVRKL